MTANPENLTETPQLGDSLEQLRLEGAIFFRSEFTEQWSFESAPTSAASMLREGAERLLYFHIVAAGESGYHSRTESGFGRAKAT